MMGKWNVLLKPQDETAEEQHGRHSLYKGIRRPVYIQQVQQSPTAEHLLSIFHQLWTTTTRQKKSKLAEAQKTYSMLTVQQKPVRDAEDVLVPLKSVNLLTLDSHKSPKQTFQYNCSVLTDFFLITLLFTLWMEDRKGNHALLEPAESHSSVWSQAGFFLHWAKWNELIYFSWVGALSLLSVRRLRHIFWNLLVWRAFLQMLISIIPAALQWFFSLLNNVTQPRHRLSLNNTARDEQQRNWWWSFLCLSVLPAEICSFNTSVVFHVSIRWQNK